jgi:hypothetical protein
MTTLITFKEFFAEAEKGRQAFSVGVILKKDNTVIMERT